MTMVSSGKRFTVTLGILGVFLAVGVLLWPVRATTGERVTCKYGETLSNTIHNISVPWWLGSRYHARKSTRLCDRHRRAEALYREGQQLLDAGKTTEAAKKFKAVAKIDSKFSNVQSAAKLAGASTSSTGGTSSGGGSSTGSTSSGSTSSGGGSSQSSPAAAEDNWNVDDLKILMPASVQGYYAGQLYEMLPNYIQNEFDAIKNPNVISVLLSIHRVSSEGKAIKWIQTSLSRGYKYDRKSVTIHGRQGHFATDRTNYGYLGWHHGRIVFEMLLQNGNNRPAETYDSAISITSQMVD